MPFADAILLPLLRGRATRCGRRYWRSGRAYLPWISSIDVGAVADSQLEEAEQLLRIHTIVDFDRLHRSPNGTPLPRRPNRVNGCSSSI
jgi:hypothetical protein